MNLDGCKTRAVSWGFNLTLPPEELQRLYLGEKAAVLKYVTDQELANWLLYGGQRKKQGGIGSLFGKERMTEKQSQMMELQRMVEKMEKWGT